MTIVDTTQEPDDDAPVGKLLTRREMLALLAGLGSAVLLAACDSTTAGAPVPTATAGAGASSPATGTSVNAEVATAAVATPVAATPTVAAAAVPGCVVRPELTEGPYFVDEKINRSDIRSDPSDNSVRPGIPLSLGFVVSQISGGACTPLPGSQIDIWHCDALGNYSDVGSYAGQKFLRGYQVTDAQGKAQFTTIYPGWYQGRAVHIHFKIRTKGTDGQPYEFTSQFFFDDAVSDAVFTQAPYSGHAGRDTRNAADNIYQAGGSQLVLALTKNGPGYSTLFPIGLDLSDTAVGKSDSNGAGGGPGGPGGGPGGPGGPPPNAPATP